VEVEGLEGIIIDEDLPLQQLVNLQVIVIVRRMAMGLLTIIWQ
jgi:hypothetical protein